MFVTTSQAGKVVVLRTDQGVVNTLSAVRHADGLTLDGGRLALDNNQVIAESFVLPDDALAAVPPLKHVVDPPRNS